MNFKFKKIPKIINFKFKKVPANIEFNFEVSETDIVPVNNAFTYTFPFNLA